MKLKEAFDMGKIRNNFRLVFIYLIGGVMVSVLTSSWVDGGFEPGRVKPKTIKLVFAASPLSMQH